MNIPGDLKYTEDHEWVRVEGNVAFVGITDHAQHELGDIVYVELPEIDMEVEKDEEATSIESVKAAAPVNSLYQERSFRLTRLWKMKLN